MEARGHNSAGLLPSNTAPVRHFIANTADVFLHRDPRVHSHMIIEYTHHMIKKNESISLFKGTSADHNRATGNSADRLRLVAQTCMRMGAWFNIGSSPFVAAAASTWTDEPASLLCNKRFLCK